MTMRRLIGLGVFVLGCLLVPAVCRSESRGNETGIVSAKAYASIQAAVDANPGKMVLVPAGDHVVDRKVRISGKGGGLYGPGRIVQSEPGQPILEIEHAEGVGISDVTLTRAKGKEDATAPGLLCCDCRRVRIEGVCVVDNRARDAAIEIRESAHCTVRDSEVLNYKRIAVDDRTGPGENLHGYAFFAIDGTGIVVRDSTHTMLVGNRIVETNLMPTPAIKDKYKLGTLTEGRHPSKPGKLGVGALLRRYVNNWHQGSGIVVTGPEVTRHTVIRGNVIENAAQGIDLHCDYAVCSDNVVDHGMMGIKATHGCRGLIISGNMLTHVDLWGILLNPGAASHHAEGAEGGKPARGANVDAGVIVANNIISDYGYGHEYWNWGGKSGDQAGSYAIALFEGQLESNPPLTDVLIEGNIVYNTGRDGVLVDGKPKVLGPRYRYAVYVGPWGETGKPGATYPRGLHFANNLLHPGTRGVSNVDLRP
ncbi:MAG: right-handed parallel beta-helix repeat-containing protein [Phycisphaerae bacterium]|nr:right-handed parallel beta-helix repeat-containing protein [Phycisphaerae bacterium]